MRCCASFEGATRVAADEAERYLEQHPALATNGKTDVLLIPLPASGQPGKRGAAFLEHDALVGRVAAAVTEEADTHAPGPWPGGATVPDVRATRTGLLRAVRTRGTGQLALGAPSTVRAPYAYQPRACRAYRGTTGTED